MLAFRIVAAQNFLMSVRCSPEILPGKRYWLPEFSWRMLATRLAAGALSGRCSVRRCLVWWEGLIQTPRFRSKSLPLLVRERVDVAQEFASVEKVPLHSYAPQFDVNCYSTWRAVLCMSRISAVSSRRRARYA
jgi:hypothetical protein